MTVSTVYDTDDALRGLLAVILDPASDSDHARLVYADRCDELGLGERAEFIRVQVELAKYQPTVVDYCLFPRKVRQGPPRNPNVLHVIEIDLADYEPCGFCPPCDLRRRERELLGPRWGDWLGPAVADGAVCLNLNPFGPGETNGWLGVSYGRGFVESVVCTAADWERHADAILAAHPVREVRLTTIGLPVWGPLRYRPKAGVIYDRWPFTVILRGTEPELLDVPLGLITQAPFDPSALTDAIRAERERIMGEVIARSLADRAPFVFGDESTDE